MSYLDYTPQQRLAHEVRILLALIELEEEAGPDLTGVFVYQREKIYELIKGVDGDGSFPEEREEHLRIHDEAFNAAFGKRSKMKSWGAGEDAA